jgi:hypothetical protein
LIKELGKTEIKQALDLVNRVFSEFVAVDYSEHGNKTFNDYLKVKYEEVINDVQAGHKRIWAYCQNDEIVGVIATRDISHIALMFVDKKHHRQGIAKQLYSTVLSEIRKNAEIAQVTVNSSPYAVEVYERLGFVKTDELQEKDGIIYVPMKHKIQELSAISPIPLGIYRHYKGNRYEVIGFAKHSETLEDMVLYKALYGDHGTWVRPLSMWGNLIEVDGKTVKRFEYVGDNKAADRQNELAEAHHSLLSTLRKCEKIDMGKLGKSQQTLHLRRIDALKLALALIEKEQERE